MRVGTVSVIADENIAPVRSCSALIRLIHLTARSYG